jgi:hypothetical protein
MSSLKELEIITQATYMTVRHFYYNNSMNPLLKDILEKVLESADNAWCASVKLINTASKTDSNKSDKSDKYKIDHEYAFRASVNCIAERDKHDKYCREQSSNTSSNTSANTSDNTSANTSDNASDNASNNTGDNTSDNTASNSASDNASNNTSDNTGDNASNNTSDNTGGNASRS